MTLFNQATRDASRVAGIMRNCALGIECQCVRAAKPWQCENWGRSPLTAPAIIGRDQSYGGGGQRVARPIKKPRAKK